MRNLSKRLSSSFFKARSLGIIILIFFSSHLSSQDLPFFVSSKMNTTETGLRMEFELSSLIERSDISSWIEQKNWFLLNFYNVIKPEVTFFNDLIAYPVQDVQQLWSQSSLQLSIQINREIGMFDVILDDEGKKVIIVLTFSDYVKEKEVNPSFVFPNPKDAKKKAHPTSWKDARERTTLEIICDTKGLPIYVDGHLVGYSPLKNKVDVLPGWHKVGYFPNNYSEDSNALTSKEKLMNDILIMGRLDIFVEEGDNETIVLNYQTLDEDVIDFNKKFQVESWVGFSLFFVIIVLMSWGMA